MNPSPDIETKAAEWLVRRDRGGESAQVRQEFEQWLAADARHRRAYLELQKTWHQADQLKTWVPHPGKVDPGILEPYATKRAWRFPVELAASIAVVIGCLLVWQQYYRPTMYTTQVGGFQRVVLEDGSVLQLNTDSVAKVRYATDARKVDLMKGEAYFQVAHEATRPFLVTAVGKTLRAVGTEFTVRVRGRNAVEVTVAARNSSPPSLA
jgi:transmembrane sensor